MQNYNSKFKILIRIAFVIIFHFALLTFNSSAANAQALRYPIADLGYCRDAKECSLYCEIPQNKPSCWSYGKYKLYPQVLGESTDDEQEAKRLGVTFPIKELGNCANVTQCKAYCELEQNRQACTNFAASKGIGQSKKHQEMISRAKEVLGCDSAESCRSLCEDPSNRNRCMEFADKYAPEEYRQKKDEILQRARTSLGCDSFETCKNFCEKEENRDKCQRFAGEHTPAEVKERIQQIREDKISTCSNEAECKKWCEQNPDKCSGYKQSGDYQRHQEEQKYYQEYKNSPTYYPQPTYRQYQYPTSYEQPQSYPTNYQQQSEGSGGSYDPATECAKTPNCSWTGSTCQCSPSQ